MGSKATDIPTCPGEERRFIYRSDVKCSVLMFRKKFCSGITVISKSGSESITKNVQSIRITVMKKVPDNVDVMFPTGIYERKDGFKIKSPLLVHKRPTNSFASRV